jgi:hypothetical protein
MESITAYDAVNTAIAGLIIYFLVNSSLAH